MIEFNIQPIESTTLAPESLQWAANLAERISLTLRSLATGRHVGNVTLDEAVQELGAVWYEVDGLASSVFDLETDGRDQLATQRDALRFGLTR